MIFVRGDPAVEQHPGIFRNVRSLRILGGEQRLPSLFRQVSVTYLGTAVPGVGARQLIHLLVAGVSGMPFDPHELNGSGTFGKLIVNRANQLGVLHGFFLRILPTVLLPTMHPLGGTVDRILGVGFNDQRLGTRMRAQRFQHGAKLPDLIGAVRGTAGIAISGMPVPVIGRSVVIGPSPTHRTVRIAQRGTVCRNRNRHVSTLRNPRDSKENR